MKIIGKIFNALFIGDDSKPVNLVEIISAISANFKKSPQTTIVGFLIVILGVVILLTRPDLDVVSYSLIGGGFSLLGVRDVWSKKNKQK